MSTDLSLPLADWVADGLVRLSCGKQRSLFCAALWNVWFARNQLIFDNVLLSHAQVYRAAQSGVEAFLQAR
ncbi:hypothetical protein ACS0TY_004296 [Phlomoides rotata]